MQAGTVVVATDIGEIPKILDFGQCGELVSPGDSNKLAKTIEKVNRNNEESRTKVVAAKYRALKEYSRDNMTSSYIEQYNIIASRYQ